MYQKRVLLVEDNRLLRRGLEANLLAAGYEVAAPESIELAMRWAEAVPFDALVTDWRLPVGHNGFQFLQRVRSRSPRAFAILMSAEMDDELARQARSCHFDRVLLKPFRLAQVPVLLASHFDPPPAKEVVT
jgi:DNA-binding response OmpR family regulator